MTDRTKSSEHRSRMVGLALVLVVIVLGVGWRFLTTSSSVATTNTVSMPAASSSSVINCLFIKRGSTAITVASSSSFNLAANLLSGSPPTLGSPNAPVTIVEFGDYQCPTCGQWYNTQEAQLIQSLVNTGKAKLVWRDFDYYGPDSVSASEAAYAAGEQGKFWQFYDLLFQSQQTPNNGWANKQKMDTFARQLGLNMTQFDQSLDNGDYDSFINSNHSLGVEAGVSETPTFFLIGPNDKMVTIAGDQPVSVFEQAVASLTS